jgi:hypothetical protein
MSVAVRKFANVLVLVAVVWLNALAATGAMSGASVGELANRPASLSLFLPASYVFGIWSLIYVGLTAFTVRQALPSDGATRAGRILGAWWPITSVLNVAWISVFSFEQYGLAMLVMLALLVSLVMVAGRVAPVAAAGTWVDRLCVAWPFHVYLAWISVAIIANTFQYAHVTGWSGFGIAESTWSVTMMVVATALGCVMAARGIWVFPLVVAWALRGIGVRWPAVGPVHNAAAVLVPLGIVGGAVLAYRALASARRQRPSAA